jgi:hypothetical protein
MSAPAERIQRPLNVLFARKPTIAIIGTGRCGTGFSSDYLTRSGIPFSHEGYYTVDGPTLRNGRRSRKAIGDCSWLAIPFLPDPEVIAIHQVRDPIKVIRSFYNIGFFDQSCYHKHSKFVDFAGEHFRICDDSLYTSMRWYLEWNRKCEQITSHRFQIEELVSRMDDIARWIGHTEPLLPVDIPETVNTRPRVIEDEIDDFQAALAKYPEYSELEEMAVHYGYTI